MIGDLLLMMKFVWKQMFCLHQYEIMCESSNDKYFAFFRCTKCGRIKKIRVYRV